MIHSNTSGRDSKSSFDAVNGTSRDTFEDNMGGANGRESKDSVITSSSRSKPTYDMHSSTSGRESKASFDVISVASGRESKVGSIVSGRESKANFYLTSKSGTEDSLNKKDGFETESVREGFDSSRGGGDGLSSVNSKEDLDKLNPVFSPMSSRDTIEPPDLFNTNKKHEGKVEQQQAVDVPRPDDSSCQQTPVWSNEKTYSSQTLSRKHSKSHSHSRSKRLRNRSLEMVLDNETSADGSTSRGEPSRSRMYSRSLERPKPRRADRYNHHVIETKH